MVIAKSSDDHRDFILSVFLADKRKTSLALSGGTKKHDFLFQYGFYVE
jgi:hypothetical protein